MPKTEIDDIFASKGKSKGTAPIKSPSDTPAASGTKIKKKDKKRKRADEETSSLPEAKASRKAAPETVVDPSLSLAATSATLPGSIKPARKADAKAVKAKTAKLSKTHGEDEARFKDSRGTGPRKKTEEGFSVYKQDELGITDGGGDTPLCPFDCDCCF